MQSLHQHNERAQQSKILSMLSRGAAIALISDAGFLPPKQSARLKKLQQLSAVQATLLLYAPPHSLAAILADAVEVLDGSRQCVVARELTKMHEEFFRGTLAAAAEEFQSRPAKGEITLVIEGAGPVDTTQDANSALRELIQSGMAPSLAVARVVKEFSVKKSSIYQLALDIKSEIR
ncbi:hypothetical protein WJX74_008034 [Apatococcus lobatus]|uniref:Uncharacterized protein n=1 Tax=Apatococcus lobatus TaxID=904363 RepID=A0AAW1RH46_9CHLO